MNVPILQGGKMNMNKKSNSKHFDHGGSKKSENKILQGHLLEIEFSWGPDRTLKPGS